MTKHPGYWLCGYCGWRVTVDPVADATGERLAEQVKAHCATCKRRPR